MAEGGVKVLLCGSVDGKLGALCKRVESVSAKAGPFACVLCVGPIFSSAEAAEAELEAYKSGAASLPVPTYFVDGGGAPGLEHGEDREVCPNLTFLGRPGARLLHGLRVASLPGRLNAATFEGPAEARGPGEYGRPDADAVRAEAAAGGPTDVLLTSEWPPGACGLTPAAGPSAAPPAARAAAGSPVVGVLCREIAPRYHAVGTPAVAYARPPWRNAGAGNVTRLVALAAVGNAGKEKWLHALSLIPAADMPREEFLAQPPDATPSPLAPPPPVAPPPGPPVGGKRPAEQPLDVTAQPWRFDQSAVAQGQRVKRQRPDYDASRAVVVNGLPPECGEGAVRALLEGCGEVSRVEVVHVGDRRGPRSYAHAELGTADAAERAVMLTGTAVGGSEVRVERWRSGARAAGPPQLPPGGSVVGCWFCLGSQHETHLVASIGTECYVALDKGPLCDGHVLVIPIEHHASTAALPPPALAELGRYTAALRECFRRERGCELLCFERYLALRGKGGNHAHVNCVPVPAGAAAGARAAFEKAAEAHGFSFEHIPAAGGGPAEAQAKLRAVAGWEEYLAVTLPDGSQLVHPIARGERHPMTFGRDVVAGILGDPSRAEWKNCTTDHDGEVSRVERFRKDFGRYDLSPGA